VEIKRQKEIDNLRSFFPATVNLYTIAFATSMIASIEMIYSFSYSCDISNFDENKNTISIYRRASTGTRGQWEEDVEDAGHIPGQYFAPARITLRQFVYWLSYYHAGFSRHHSNEEREIAQSVVSLALYHLLVFLDLMQATPIPVPRNWRWERFDQYLQREVHLSGRHDPTDSALMKFQYPEDDPTGYGT
jgi:hypothetical protein